MISKLPKEWLPAIEWLEKQFEERTYLWALYLEYPWALGSVYPRPMVEIINNRNDWRDMATWPIPVVTSRLIPDDEAVAYLDTFDCWVLERDRPGSGVEPGVPER